jgi:hypothetical protein
MYVPRNYDEGEGSPPRTWEILERQYTAQWDAGVQVESVPVVREQTGFSPGTFLACTATVGALVFIFDRKSSKAAKAVAFQVLGISMPVALNTVFSSWQ